MIPADRGPLRVLVVHNRHRSDLPSGENRAVDLDLAMLANRDDVVVATYEVRNDEIARMGPLGWAALAARPLWSPSDSRALHRLIERARPDVVHVHNVYPMLSPGVVRTARAVGLPVVHTVHNYRHVCAAGTHFRNGRVCHDCGPRGLPVSAVVHGCYRGSRAQTAVIAASLAIHRGTWRMADRLIAISPAVAAHLVAAGFEAQRVVVKPNTVADPGPPSPPGSGLLFVGRLSPEKGIPLLLDAWERSALAGTGRRLTIAGDGPLRAWVESAVRRVDGVGYAGPLSPQGVDAAIKEAAAVVVPSVWEEPFGLVVIEALARGRAVVATAVGAPAGMVDATVGRVVKPEAGALAAAIDEVLSADLSRLGAAARRRYEAVYDPEAITDRLVAIYSDVVEARRRPVSA